MTELDRMIMDVRVQRKWFSDRRHEHSIEAAACAIRERALLDARRAVVGRVDPGFEFYNGGSFARNTDVRM